MMSREKSLCCTQELCSICSKKISNVRLQRISRLSSQPRARLLCSDGIGGSRKKGSEYHDQEDLGSLMIHKVGRHNGLKFWVQMPRIGILEQSYAIGGRLQNPVVLTIVFLNGVYGENKRFYRN